MNRQKKRLYYQNKINDLKYDGKKLWKTFNNILDRSEANNPSFIESEGTFITKPHKVADHLNNFLSIKLKILDRK